MRIVSTLAIILAISLLAQDNPIQRPEIQKALTLIESKHNATLDAQVPIAEIPAPAFHESDRAK